MTETFLMKQLISAVEALKISSALDIVIAVASPTLALAAIFISIYTARKQNDIALFDKRYEIYSKIRTLLKIGGELEQNPMTSKESGEASPEDSLEPKHCKHSLFLQLNLLSVQLFAAQQLLQRQQPPRPEAEPCVDTPLTRLDLFFRQLPLERQIDWETKQKVFFQQKESLIIPADVLDANAAGFPVAPFLTALQSLDHLADQIPLLFPALSPKRVETLQSSFDTYAFSLLNTYAAYSEALPNTLKQGSSLPQGSSLLELYAPYAALPLKGSDVTPEVRASLLADAVQRLSDQGFPLFSALSPEQAEILRSAFDSYAFSLLKLYAPYTALSLKTSEGQRTATPDAHAATPKEHTALLADVMQRLVDQLPSLFSALSLEQTETLQNTFDSYALSLLELYAPYAALSLKTPEKRAALLADVMKHLAKCQQDVEALETSIKNLDDTLNDFITQCRSFEEDCLPAMRETLSPSASWWKRIMKKIRQLF